MKATIEAEALRSAVARVAPFAATGVVTPALTCVRIEAKTDRLVLLSTDVESWGSTEAAAAVGEPGAALVPAPVLSKLVGQLAGEVTLSAVDDDLEVSAAGRSYTVRLADLAAHPRTSPPTADAVPLGEAWGRIARVARAASLDPVGGVKRGVHFDGGSAQATDTYRLSWAETPEVGECIVAAPALARAAKVLGDGVTMAVGDGVAVFADGTTTVATTLIVGDYPRTAALIPDRTAHTLYVDAAELTAAVAGAMALVGVDDGNSSEMVELAHDGGVLHLTRSVQDVGSSGATVEAAGTWPETGVALNAKYLATALQSAGAERVAIGAETELKPVTVTGGDVSTLVMAIRRKGVR